MPREEAKELFDLIKPIGKFLYLVHLNPYFDLRFPALNIDPKLFIEIMGSYRRCHQKIRRVLELLNQFWQGESDMRRH